MKANPHMEIVTASDADAALQISPVPRISVQAFCETPEVAALINEEIGRAHV